MLEKTLRLAIGTALCAGGLATAVQAQEEQESADSAFTANIGVTSNYVWRGASQTLNGPAVQGGVDYGDGSGFYIGTWMSNVNFGDSVELTDEDEDGVSDGGTVESGFDYELDGYIGWGGDLAENVGLDLGYVYYHYGQLESGYDFGEVYANVSLWWFNVGAYYTTNSQIDGNDFEKDTSKFVSGDIFYYGAFAFDFAQSWSLGLTVGQYDFNNDSSANPLSYTYGQIDLSKSAGRYGDFTLSVSQAGEEADGNDNTKVFVTWSKGWYSKFL